ncbi:hypothetical protein V8E54_014053 [Elaphomyces granulatus]|jgi:hypothetical protein
MAGETGPLSSVSLAIAMTIAGFFAISCYNVVEINISIFNMFKRRRGLYFWSMLVASWGIAVHAIAVFLRYFALAPDFLMCVQTIIGWYAMVTGQSVVLYSRLHLVVSDTRHIRWVLAMIITNFFILHVPVTILFLASNLDPQHYLNAFNIYERIQLVGFTLQECIISSMYIYETIHAIKPLLAVRGPEERKVIHYVIIVNVLAVLLDISLCTTEFTGHFDIQTTYKPVVYSIKLKMEFHVLNWLLAIIQRGHCTCSNSKRRIIGNCSGHGEDLLSPNIDQDGNQKYDIVSPGDSGRRSGIPDQITTVTDDHLLPTVSLDTKSATLSTASALNHDVSHWDKSEESSSTITSIIATAKLPQRPEP